MNKNTTRMITGTAILLAIVLVLQTLGGLALLPSFLTNLNLSLVPIAIGAIMYGPISGLFLGLMSGLHIVITGQAALFMGFAPVATVIVCLLKGGLSGLASGFVYKLLEKKNTLVAAIVASLVIPFVNTGVFVIAMFTILNVVTKAYVSETVNSIGVVFGLFVGFNFFIELAITAVFTPAIDRIVKILKKRD